MNPQLAVRRFRGIGTTAEVAVTDSSRLDVAERVLRDELRAIDETCSRFRADSEISQLHDQAGTAVEISPLLTEALSVALRAADLTDGIVDPTVGQAMRDVGYDKDFDLLDRDSPAPVAALAPAPGWWRIRLDTARREVVLPRGVLLDLGATAKALAADRAAALAADATGCGVLVGLGGDIAVAGRSPEYGWGIAIGDDHARTDPQTDPAVAISSGGLATSSTACRFWRRAGRPLHHIVDPRTGDIPEEVWRTVSVTAATCVDANSATTAAIVLGHEAVEWLTTHRLPARLVTVDGRVRTVAGWPEDDCQRPGPASSL